MNRPKKRRRSKGPLHPFPLTRTADLEARRAEERGLATALPLIWTQGLWMVVLIVVLAVSVHLRIHATGTGSSGIASPESVSRGARFTWWIVSNFSPGLAIFLCIHWWLVRRLRRRWVREPARSVDEPGPALWFFALALLLLLLATLLGSALIAALLTGSLLATYLLITGIRRRVGRDPRCARCAYPEPNPNTPLHTCPECGTDRADPLAIILGRNARSPARIITALTLLAGAATLFILR